MAADYATLADLKAHWSKLPAEDETDATQKLREASIEIRGNFRDVDRRIGLWAVDPEDPNALDPDVPQLVVCRMVKRAMDSPDGQIAGVNQIQQSAGPFGQTLSFTNPDGNIYLSKADRALLGVGRVKGKAFTIHPGSPT